MGAVLPFPVETRCGYCLRRLVTAERGYECPRCAPLLRSLLAVPDYEITLAAFRRFQQQAWADRDRSAS